MVTVVVPIMVPVAVSVVVTVVVTVDVVAVVVAVAVVVTVAPDRVMIGAINTRDARTFAGVAGISAIARTVGHRFAGAASGGVADAADAHGGSAGGGERRGAECGNRRKSKDRRTVQHVTLLKARWERGLFGSSNIWSDGVGRRFKCRSGRWRT
jgi:hypothetical protein